MDTQIRTDLALIDELSAEHAELLPEIERIMNLATISAPTLGDAIAALADRLGAALDHHIAQEDEVLFPAFADASDHTGVLDQFVQEHREIQALRDQLISAQRAGAARQELGQIALALADLLSSHMAREDMMLFPTIRERLG